MEKSSFTAEYQLLRTMLRDVRVRCNVTQEELAERLNATQSFVSKCERGERRLDLVQLKDFCHALQIELTDFVQEFAQRLKQKPHRSRTSPKTKAARR